MRPQTRFLFLVTFYPCFYITCGLITVRKYHSAVPAKEIPLTGIKTVVMRSKLECVKGCSFLGDCLGVHYTKPTGICEFLRPMTKCGPEWTPPPAEHVIWSSGIHLTTYTAFRSSSGNGQVFYSPWVTDSFESNCTEDVFDMNRKINFTYKHPILRNWSKINILKVKVTLWKDGLEVVRLLFNGEKSDKTTWFSRDRLMESSFTDLLNASSTFAMSMFDGQRTFYLYHAHGGCGGDWGWMVCRESQHSCDWENRPPYPAFLYSPTHDVIHWSDSEGTGPAVADDFVISLEVEV